MNGTMLQGFEWYLPADGQHWNRLAAMAPELRRAGFTAIWLPPAYKGAAGKNDVGYGVYDLYDLGEFDQKGSVPTKYGTRADYLKAIDALHRAQLQVLPDIVLNHRMGADGCEEVRAEAVNAGAREQNISGEESVQVWTKFTFPGRGGKYSDFCWDWNCFDGVDWDERTRCNELLRFSGKSWDGEVDGENGNYDYLMGADLDMSQPKVCQELSAWGKWYLDTTGADGVRLDAIKHINREFYTRWLDDLRRSTGRELFAVGEYWSAELPRLLAYLDGDNSCMSLFDVPLHYKFRAASCSNGSQDMGALFSDTLVACRPIQAVTFVDNHDTQPGQSLTSFVEPWFRPAAYAAILLRADGYPCVFYGDWCGIPHDGIAPLAELPLLVALRAKCAYGEQRDYFDHPDVVGWTRLGSDEAENSGLAALFSDSRGGEKRMFVGTARAGESWVPVLGGGEAVCVDGDGCALFSVGDGSLRVYVPAAAVSALRETDA